MNFKKITSTVLAAMMAMSVMATPAFAVDGTPGKTGDDITTTTKDIPVSATVKGAYVLVIPESVALTNSAGGAGTYSSDFNVSITGDIGESQTVTVATTAPTMHRDGSKDVISTVTTPKTTWNRDEVLAATASTYTVKADLTPGAWAGVMTFNCTLK